MSWSSGRLRTIIKYNIGVWSCMYAGACMNIIYSTVIYIYIHMYIYIYITAIIIIIIIIIICSWFCSDQIGLHWGFLVNRWTLTLSCLTNIRWKQRRKDAFAATRCHHVEQLSSIYLFAATVVICQWFAVGCACSCVLCCCQRS